ncbi:MAG: phosphate ABC transporter permease PstA, partial [Ureaplasma sp.]|nr:phosphate ABC transporter permease PstA [Ureaplasma sp.]
FYDSVAFKKKTEKNDFQNIYNSNIFGFSDFSITNFDISKHISSRNKNSKWLYVYSYWKIFWEILSSVIVFGFIGWIVLDILINGFATFGNDNSTFFQFDKDSTGQAFVNTLFIILVTIAITFPIALLIAIYLNEYVKNKRTKKTALFFIDSLGATPSIIFGMFGLAFFIQVLGISIQGRSGQSLLAGALTVGIVLLPNFIRNIQQALENVPSMIRENGYALGCLKNEVVFKLVLSMAFKSIVSAIILSVGRIISETAPLYLTAGLSSPNNIALLSPGQTLTTRIYANTMFGINANQSLNIQYESALSSILLVLFLTVLGYMIIPYYKYLKEEIKMRLLILKQMKDLNLKSRMKLLSKQIYE